jgi:hypothetical protein
MALPLVPFVVNMIPKSLSGETHQDSEPHLTVNPANPQQIVGTAFTPPPAAGPNAPVYVSLNGGNDWFLNLIVPSSAGTGTGTFDITTSFNANGSKLYAGILRDPTSNLEFLRTNNFSGGGAMTVLSSRPNADQPFTHATTNAGSDRVYIGDNDFNAAGGRTQTLDESLNAGIAAPVFNSVRVEKRATAGQNGPQCRPASHPDGTVYAAFYGWRNQAGSFPNNTLVITADVVVVRDDAGGAGANPFTALVDAGDGLAGRRVAQGVVFPFNRNGAAATGQQRIGGSISIAVDPNNSSTVYLAWGDRQAGSFLTLHVRRSVDRGVTWSGDLLTINNATNGSLAVNSNGVVALLYQQVVGAGAGQQWASRVSIGPNAANWVDYPLAITSAIQPVKSFDPYLGDYDHILAVGADFYGIFSASNLPSIANFPNGVRYQRNANFSTATLLNVDNVTPVPVSIDPFFFKFTKVSTVGIASAAFPGVFLRVDGSGVTGFLGPGGGVVNCQFGLGPFEKFQLQEQTDGTVAIASIAFPGVYIRMDGSGVTGFTGPGGGVVNCQFGIGPFEKFNLVPQADGTFAFVSKQFGTALRIDGSGVTAFSGPGSGVVIANPESARGNGSDSFRSDRRRPAAGGGDRGRRLRRGAAHGAGGGPLPLRHHLAFGAIHARRDFRRRHARVWTEDGRRHAGGRVGLATAAVGGRADQRRDVAVRGMGGVAAGRGVGECVALRVAAAAVAGRVHLDCAHRMGRSRPAGRGPALHPLPRPAAGVVRRDGRAADQDLRGAARRNHRAPLHQRAPGPRGRRALLRDQRRGGGGATPSRHGVRAEIECGRTNV